MFWAGLDEGHDWGALTCAAAQRGGEKRSRRSPARVAQATAVLAGNSITQNALRASASRQGFTARLTFTTRPSRAANTTSMGNRMKNVCTPPHGAITRPVPGSSRSRPSRPFFRVAESKAASSRETRMCPDVRFRTAHSWSGDLTSGARKWLTMGSPQRRRQMVMRTRARNRTGRPFFMAG